MSGFIVECENLEPGEQVWFKSEFEAERTIVPDSCCAIKPVGDDYAGPRWVPED